MSLFPAFPATSEFGPLFRLLDDYDTHRSGRGGQGGQAVRAFQPKFDVRETKESYELHGELPGIDQKDVSIEFSDPTTLVIKGRVEREYTSGPEGQQQQGRITGDVTEQNQNQSQSQGQTQTQSHKATVEDEGQEGQSQQQQAPQQQPEAEKQVQQQQQKGDQQVAKKGHHHHHHAKYWVTERSVGEFYRSFSFPTRVDQDNVKANLKNGILTIHVPKAAAHQAKRINIE